jgi:cell division septation protein DedD/nucleoid DNA-binding protein
MQLDKHIGSLLYKHNCVIITDFGGFVTNYKSAAIHPVQHTFTAPSKQIAFNRNLTSNDGLLANYISQKLSVSYPEACRIIANFVEACNRELESGKKIVFANVGELFFDREKNLQFVPQTEVNYLLDSFGLSSFQSPAVKRDERMIELAEMENIIPSVSRRKNKSKIWRLIEVVPVAAALTYFIINSSLTANLNASFASLNPFANNTTEKAEATPSPVQPQSGVANNEAEIIAEPAPVITTPTVTEEKTEPVTALPKEIIAPAKEEVVTAPIAIKPALTSSTNHSLYIVGGCFSVPENAEKLVQQLKNEGYPAMILGKNAKGMNMVGIASAANRSKAEEMLGFIQESGYPDAWIFRKK